VGSFGEKLRQQRERRGLSLDAISTTTKISTRMLRAIEDEHFDQLPGGVFNKGFVRAYARQVGLNEEEAVTDYLDALRESQIQSQTILPDFRSPANGRTQPQSPQNEDRHNRDRHKEDRPREARHYQDLHKEDRRTTPDRRLETRRTTDPHNLDHHNLDPHNLDPHNLDPHNDARHNDARHNEVPLPEIRITEAPIPVPRQPRPAETHLDENFPEALPSPPPSFLNLHEPSSPQPNDLAPPNSSSPGDPRIHWEKLLIPLILITLAVALWTLHRRTAAASQPAPSHAVASAATSPSLPTAPPAPAAPSPATHTTTPDLKPPAPQPTAQVSKPKPPPTFTLVIRAAQTSWIAITADGQPVAHETLFAPANTSVRATHEIVVRAGNAAGLSFTLNHLDIPAQGAPNEVRVYTFDSTGLRNSTPVPPTTQPATN
jgi:cytoskeletal protein RodZ